VSQSASMIECLAHEHADADPVAEDGDPLDRDGDSDMETESAGQCGQTSAWTWSPIQILTLCRLKKLLKDSASVREVLELAEAILGRGSSMVVETGPLCILVLCLFALVLDVVGDRHLLVLCVGHSLSCQPLFSFSP
jgi:hypothetical protein